MPDTLRWGIIGCGDVVEHKSGPAIRQAGNSTIVAVMRRDGSKAREYAHKHGIALWTGDPSEVIDNEDTDIVYVATPPNAHLGYVLAAAKAGKHVLVEKPMGLNADEARAMIAACESAGVLLFVAYYRRFHPHVVKMRQLIRDGRIGVPVQSFIDIAVDVSGGHSLWRENPEISGGGHFVDVGSHRLDTMVFLLGKIQDVRGVATTFDEKKRVEQAVSLCVKFESGALSSDPLDGHAVSLRTADGTEDLTFEKFSAPHLGLIRHIEKVVAGQAENESSGQDGLMTEIILDEAVRRNMHAVERDAAADAEKPHG
jgi:predicted dehydrogenase